MKQIVILLTSLFSLQCYAQNKDTISINPGAKNRIYTKQLYSPSSLIIAGVFSEIKFGKSLDAVLYRERNMDFPRFHSRLDNYLQYSPILLAYGFDALGMTFKTDILNRSVILLKSEVLMSASVTVLKYTIREPRPDGSARNSVPSGHTAQAFAAAAFLSEEFGNEYRWVPYFSYSIASTVGAMRIMNNRHYLSDVLIGAGIGILSTKVSYWTHRYNWGEKQKQYYHSLHASNQL